MKKVLVILAHPNLQASRINKRWAEEIQKYDNVTLHDLYQTYPDGNINVEREQQLLLEHDRIVLQFPFYWYSSPALLKQWQDVVLSYGFAYGSTGTKLHGKELLIAVSSGGGPDEYQAGGRNQYTLSELLRPFQATSNLIGTRYLPIFNLGDVYQATDEALEKNARAYVQHALAEY